MYILHVITTFLTHWLFIYVDGDNVEGYKVPYAGKQLDEFARVGIFVQAAVRLETKDGNLVG